MTVFTIFGDAADGRIQSHNAAYATADAGSNLGADSGSPQFNEAIGQYIGADYVLSQFGIVFDTSAISGIITGSILSLYGAAATVNQNFIIEVVNSNWGPTLATTDWVASASFPSVLAAFDTSSTWSTTGYNDFVEGSGHALSNALNLSGKSYWLCVSNRQGTTPSVAEVVGCFSADQAGTTNDPKLTVTTIDVAPDRDEGEKPREADVLPAFAQAAAEGESLAQALRDDEWVPVSGATPALDRPDEDELDRDSSLVDPAPRLAEAASAAATLADGLRGEEWIPVSGAAPVLDRPDEDTGEYEVLFDRWPGMTLVLSSWLVAEMSTRAAEEWAPPSGPITVTITAIAPSSGRAALATPAQRAGRAAIATPPLGGGRGVPSTPPLDGGRTSMPRPGGN